MNILGAVLFLLACIAIYARSQYSSYAQLQASKRVEIASLDAEIADKRAQVAAFAMLFNEVEQLKQTKDIYERELAQLDHLYEQKIERNMLLHKMYGAFDEAMKESGL